VHNGFLGSGTSAAVAHKMGRRYIGIEMGDHALTHCAPRLKKVIEGEQGGISEPVGWKGGDGFRFYKLGAPVFDSEGRINPEIRFAHLAAHIWFSETHTALHKKAHSPLLGRQNGTAYYLLYNGQAMERSSCQWVTPFTCGRPDPACRRRLFPSAARPCRVSLGDALTSLVNWVEQGVAPETIIAKKDTPPMTRPLCVFPKVAKYQGGDTNDAKNFICIADEPDFNQTPVPKYGP
jgi:hypothetical protein